MEKNVICTELCEIGQRQATTARGSVPFFGGSDDLPQRAMKIEILAIAIVAIDSESKIKCLHPGRGTHYSAGRGVRLSRSYRV